MNLYTMSLTHDYAFMNTANSMISVAWASDLKDGNVSFIVASVDVPIYQFVMDYSSPNKEIYYGSSYKNYGDETLV